MPAAPLGVRYVQVPRRAVLDRLIGHPVVARTILVTRKKMPASIRSLLLVALIVAAVEAMYAEVAGRGLGRRAWSSRVQRLFR